MSNIPTMHDTEVDIMSETLMNTEEANANAFTSANRTGETLFNLIILALSVYVLAALIIDTFFTLPQEVSSLLLLIDNCICVIFLLDFFIRFFHAENKIRFMRWGWIDLLSSVPAVPALRTGRAIRIFRILRLLRGFRSTKHLVQFVFKSKLKGTLTTVSLIALLMVIFSSIAILQVEKDPASNIRTAEDALWWSYVTITTVGYGDKFPVTTEGRIIAAFLMTTGVGLFGTFTAFLASWFVEKNDDNSTSNN